MSFIIREKWIWIIIGACILAGVLPWVVIWLILQFPGILGAISVWNIIFSWAIAAGYMDWLVDRRKREKLTGSLDSVNSPQN
jgi:hypothetical protein